MAGWGAGWAPVRQFVSVRPETVEMKEREAALTLAAERESKDIVRSTAQRRKGCAEEFERVCHPPH